MPALDRARASLAARFISSVYLTDEATSAIGDWFHAKPSRPIFFRDFLREDVALVTARMMRRLPVWSRVARIYEGDDSAVQVSEQEWEASDRKWARSWIATPLDQALVDGAMPSEDTKALEQFLAFATMGGPLRDWIGAATGTDLARIGSIEFAAYGTGDRIGVHQDRIGPRMFAMNFYLDPDYQIGQGARLGYRNEAGEESLVDPVFNTLSIIPIEPSSVHWVEPFTGDGMGRLTISVGQDRRDDT